MADLNNFSPPSQPTNLSPNPSSLEVSSPAIPTLPSPKPPRAARRWLYAVVAILLLPSLGAGAGYAWSRYRAQPMVMPVTMPTSHTIPLPAEATVISECVDGVGKQYILPKDIPFGPIYNVWQGQVIGVQYMISKEDLLNHKTYSNIPLHGISYDHLNIGLLAEGHAGFANAHYHVDLFVIDKAAADKIVCDQPSSGHQHSM